jgi:putative ABC transport system substrate-binding protein
MKRRTFMAGLGSAAVWPLMARAQQPERMRRIGVLMNAAETETEYQSYLAAFIRGLRQSGWTEGRNLRIDVRWNAFDAGLSRVYAAQLIALMPDVILASSTISLTEVRQATSTVPVVFVSVADPVAQGFVSSIRQPGGNITGFSLYDFSTGSKWLSLLKEAAPSLTRFAVMFNPDFPQSKFYMRVIEAAAPSLGVHTMAMPIRASADIEPALASFVRAPSGGLVVLPDSFMRSRSRLIAALASRYRLPSIGGDTYARNGVLMEYGVKIDLPGQFRGAATYVDRILKGEKPGDLPVQAPTKYEMVINLKTAKALGITIPETLLATADEVI